MKSLIGIIIVICVCFGCDPEQEIHDIYNKNKQVSETVFVSDDGMIKVVITGDNINEVTESYIFYQEEINRFGNSINDLYNFVPETHPIRINK